MQSVDGDPRCRTAPRPVSDATLGATSNASEEELDPLPGGFIPGGDVTSGGGDGSVGVGGCGSLSSSPATRSLSSPPAPPPQPRGAIPPQHGHDMSILTLGRIADGFRRDTYAFDVDLKGRGEGRAAEARAVLQVRRKPCSPASAPPLLDYLASATSCHAWHQYLSLPPHLAFQRRDRQCVLEKLSARNRSAVGVCRLDFDAAITPSEVLEKLTCPPE